MTQTNQPGVDERVARELAERAEAEGATSSGGVGCWPGCPGQVLETGLKVQMSEHLCDGQHDPAGRGGGSSRNGTGAETVSTGLVRITVPRDREGSFEAKTRCLRQRRLADVGAMVILPG